MVSFIFLKIRAEQNFSEYSKAKKMIHNNECNTEVNNSVDESLQDVRMHIYLIMNILIVYEYWENKC